VRDALGISSPPAQKRSDAIISQWRDALQDQPDLIAQATTDAAAACAFIIEGDANTCGPGRPADGAEMEREA